MKTMIEFESLGIPKFRDLSDSLRIDIEDEKGNSDSPTGNKVIRITPTNKDSFGEHIICTPEELERNLAKIRLALTTSVTVRDADTFCPSPLVAKLSPEQVEELKEQIKKDGGTKSFLAGDCFIKLANDRQLAVFVDGEKAFQFNPSRIIYSPNSQLYEVNFARSMNTRDFGWALRQMRAGKKVRRKDRAGVIAIVAGSVLIDLEDDGHSIQEFATEWLLATDWEIVPEHDGAQASEVAVGEKPKGMVGEPIAMADLADEAVATRNKLIQALKNAKGGQRFRCKAKQRTVDFVAGKEFVSFVSHVAPSSIEFRLEQYRTTGFSTDFTGDSNHDVRVIEGPLPHPLTADDVGKVAHCSNGYSGILAKGTRPYPFMVNSATGGQIDDGYFKADGTNAFANNGEPYVTHLEPAPVAQAEEKPVVAKMNDWTVRGLINRLQEIEDQSLVVHINGAGMDGIRYDYRPGAINLRS